MSASPSTARVRVEARVTGVVQGVGFRPFVYGLAREAGLDGWVLNDERGVLIEVEGPPGEVERFLARVESEAPPLARVEGLNRRAIGPRGVGGGFTIEESGAGGEHGALVSADMATCADCLAEVLDPADRRHRYPFTNCTNCGPRLTIVVDVPYDRPATTMASFEMCARCRAEYEDPGDRRFHAQPNACPDCGPRLRLVDRYGAEVPGGGDALARTASALRDGRIVAIKGVGGYHLACRAASEPAVAALRARKHREDKPFALMVSDPADARELIELSEEDERLLAAPEAPIVIARRRAGAAVAASVAPASSELGVMLPYTPLHHLLLGDVGEPLVMTSANASDEPIAFEDGDAISRLAEIADLFCVHDREIRTRVDDSVVRSTARPDGPLLIRRSRGHVPGAISLAEPLRRPVLACGAELKSTFCIGKGEHAWVSHHIGDLKTYETLASFRDGVDHLSRLFAVEPELVAHDLHPDYLSTRYALEREGVERVAVQHHHAHLAAVLAEHGADGEAVGAIYDGTGLGPDGTVWGGELLVGDAGGYERAGLLHPVRLPGGDAATREPWRMAAAWLAAALGREDPPPPEPIAREIEPERWEAICRMVTTGVASPLTSSAGRLFDAVAALCGLRNTVNYEGQAAAELEAIAEPQPGRGYGATVIAEEDGPLVLDAREAVRDVADDIGRGTAPGLVSGRFHEALAAATSDACSLLASRRGTATVALAGGVFQNRLLLERTAELLEAAGLRVLAPRQLPPNDGAISFGQLAVAAAGGGSRE